jgi:hypothetical protein
MYKIESLNNNQIRPMPEGFLNSDFTISFSNEAQMALQSGKGCVSLLYCSAIIPKGKNDFVVRRILGNFDSFFDIRIYEGSDSYCVDFLDGNPETITSISGLYREASCFKDLVEEELINSGLKEYKIQILACEM